MFGQERGRTFPMRRKENGRGQQRRGTSTAEGPAPTDQHSRGRKISCQLKEIVDSPEAHRRGMIQLSHKTVVSLEKCRVPYKKSHPIKKRRRLQIISDSESDDERPYKQINQPNDLKESDAKGVVIVSDEESAKSQKLKTETRSPLNVDLIDSDSDQNPQKNCKKLRRKRHFLELFGSDSEDETNASVLKEKFKQHSGKAVIDENRKSPLFDGSVRGVGHLKSETRHTDVNEDKNEMVVDPGGHADVNVNAQPSGDKNEVPVLKIKVTATFPEVSFEIEKSTEEPDSSTLPLDTSSSANTSSVISVLEKNYPEKNEVKSVEKQDFVSSSGLPASPLDNSCIKSRAGLIRVRDCHSLGISENWGSLSNDKSASNIPTVSAAARNPISSNVPSSGLTNSSESISHKKEKMIRYAKMIMNQCSNECAYVLNDTAMRLTCLIRDCASWDKEVQECNYMTERKTGQAASFLGERMESIKKKRDEEKQSVKEHVTKEITPIEKYFPDRRTLCVVLCGLILENQCNELVSSVVEMVKFILDKQILIPGISRSIVNDTLQSSESSWHTISDSSLNSVGNLVPGSALSDCCPNVSSPQYSRPSMVQETLKIAPPDLQKKRQFVEVPSINSMNLNYPSNVLGKRLNQNFRDIQKNQSNVSEASQSNRPFEVPHVNCMPQNCPVVCNTQTYLAGHPKSVQQSHLTNDSNQLAQVVSNQLNELSHSAIQPMCPSQSLRNLPPSNPKINASNHLVQSFSQQLSSTPNALANFPVNSHQRISNLSPQKNPVRGENESSQNSHATLQNTCTENLQRSVNTVIHSEIMQPTSIGPKSSIAQPISSYTSSSQLCRNLPEAISWQQKLQKNTSDIPANQNDSNQLHSLNSHNIQLRKTAMQSHPAAPKVPLYHQQNTPQQLQNQPSPLLQSQSQHTPYQMSVPKETRYLGQHPQYQSLQVPYEQSKTQVAPYQRTQTEQVPYREPQIRQLPFQSTQVQALCQYQSQALPQPTKSQYALPQASSYRVPPQCPKSQLLSSSQSLLAEYLSSKYSQTQSQVSYQPAQATQSSCQQTQSAQVPCQQSLSLQHPFRGNQPQVSYQDMVFQGKPLKFLQGKFSSTPSQTQMHPQSQTTHCQTGYMQLTQSHGAESQQTPSPCVPLQESSYHTQPQLRGQPTQTQSSAQSSQVRSASMQPVVAAPTQIQGLSVQAGLAAQSKACVTEAQAVPNQATLTQTPTAPVLMAQAPIAQYHLARANVGQVHLTQASAAKAQVHVSHAHPTQSHPSRAPPALSLMARAPPAQSHISRAPLGKSHPVQALPPQSHPTQVPPTHTHPDQASSKENRLTRAPSAQFHTARAPTTQSHTVEASRVKSHPVQALPAQAHPTQVSPTQTHPAQASTENHLTRAPPAQSHRAQALTAQFNPTQTPSAESQPVSAPPVSSHTALAQSNPVAQHTPSQLWRTQVMQRESQGQFVQVQSPVPASLMATNQRENVHLKKTIEHANPPQNGSKRPAGKNISFALQDLSRLVNGEDCNLNENHHVRNASKSPHLLSLLSHSSESSGHSVLSPKNSELTLASLLGKPMASSQSMEESSDNLEPTTNAQILLPASSEHRQLPLPTAATLSLGSEVLPPQCSPAVTAQLPSYLGIPSHTPKLHVSPHSEVPPHSDELIPNSCKTLPEAEICIEEPSSEAGRNSSSDGDKLCISLQKEVLRSNTRVNSLTSSAPRIPMFDEMSDQDRLNAVKYWEEQNVTFNQIREEIAKVKSMLESTDSVSTRKDEESVVPVGRVAIIDGENVLSVGKQEKKKQEGELVWQHDQRLEENHDLQQLEASVLQELVKSADDSIVCSVKRELDNIGEQTPDECSAQYGDCSILSENIIAIKEESENLGLPELKKDVSQENSLVGSVFNSVPDSNEDKPSVTQSVSVSGGRTRSVSLDSGYKSPSPHLLADSIHHKKDKSQPGDKFHCVGEREYICANCPKTAVIYCSACNGTCYCSEECQTDHWYLKHNVECDGVPETETNVSSFNPK